MKERNEDSAYLEPVEQMALAAKVNRLCEGEDEELDQASVDDVSEIVRSLVPRIKRTGSYIRYTDRSTGTSSVSQGSTSRGEISTPFDYEKETDLKLGKIHEYRLGGYVIIKKRKPIMGEVLIFEGFFGRGDASDTSETYKRKTEVIYGKNLEPMRISRFYDNSIRIGNTTIIKWKERKLWERGKFLLQESPASTS